MDTAVRPGTRPAANERQIAGSQPADVFVVFGIAPIASVAKSESTLTWYPSRQAPEPESMVLAEDRGAVRTAASVSVAEPRTLPSTSTGMPSPTRVGVRMKGPPCAEVPLACAVDEVHACGRPLG